MLGCFQKNGYVFACHPDDFAKLTGMCGGNSPDGFGQEKGVNRAITGCAGTWA